jgi:2'-5' RNA ligase
MKRLFFALWPDDLTRLNCAHLAQQIQSVGKPVFADNLHVTVLFLGQINNAQQQAMTAAAAQIKPAAMQLCFDHLAYWKKPAIVCLRSRQTDANLSLLVEQLQLAAMQNDLSFEERPYVPHVTLLRHAQSLPQILFEPIEWNSDGFCLVESRSTPHGVEYSVLERWGGNS